ncbi:hypothetical protein K491DRAFT_781035 [Lophiostoma macrostomum CBS 122681]|uniref:Uncharacterized protein n=1 Tax=Lophiostoma macrostomum CBS 122681 TaxID=1314788 RepID=A0A6A6SXK5_9PLEO|nr:hypothetical protein K491DRAFT_781035 [Lophiostoma macrostomum CBS 122681]
MADRFSSSSPPPASFSSPWQPQHMDVSPASSTSDDWERLSLRDVASVGSSEGLGQLVEMDGDENDDVEDAFSEGSDSMSGSDGGVRLLEEDDIVEVNEENDIVELDEEDDILDADRTTAEEDSVEVDQTMEVDRATEADDTVQKNETMETVETTDTDETMPADETTAANKTRDGDQTTTANETTEADGTREAGETIDIDDSIESDAIIETNVSIRPQDYITSPRSDHSGETVDLGENDDEDAKTVDLSPRKRSDGGQGLLTETMLNELSGNEKVVDWFIVLPDLISASPDPPFVGPHSAIELQYGPNCNRYLHTPRTLSWVEQQEYSNVLKQIWTGWEPAMSVWEDDLALIPFKTMDKNGNDMSVKPFNWIPASSWKLRGPSDAPFPITPSHLSPFTGSHCPIYILGTFFNGYYMHIPRYLSRQEVTNAVRNVAALCSKQWDWGDQWGDKAIVRLQRNPQHVQNGIAFNEAQKEMAEFFERELGVDFTAQDGDVPTWGQYGSQLWLENRSASAQSHSTLYGEAKDLSMNEIPRSRRTRGSFVTPPSSSSSSDEAELDSPEHAKKTAMSEEEKDFWRSRSFQLKEQEIRLKEEQDRSELFFGDTGLADDLESILSSSDDAAGNLTAENGLENSGSIVEGQAMQREDNGEGDEDLVSISEDEPAEIDTQGSALNQPSPASSYSELAPEEEAEDDASSVHSMESEGFQHVDDTQSSDNTPDNDPRTDAFDTELDAEDMGQSVSYGNVQARSRATSIRSVEGEVSEATDYPQGHDTVSQNERNSLVQETLGNDAEAASIMWAEKEALKEQEQGSEPGSEAFTGHALATDAPDQDTTEWSLDTQSLKNQDLVETIPIMDADDEITGELQSAKIEQEISLEVHHYSREQLEPLPTLTVVNENGEETTLEEPEQEMIADGLINQLEIPKDDQQTQIDEEDEDQARLEPEKSPEILASLDDGNALQQEETTSENSQSDSAADTVEPSAVSSNLPVDTIQHVPGIEQHEESEDTELFDLFASVNTQESGSQDAASSITLPSVAAQHTSGSSIRFTLHRSYDDDEHIVIHPSPASPSSCLPRTSLSDLSYALFALALAGGSCLVWHQKLSPLSLADMADLRAGLMQLDTNKFGIAIDELQVALLIASDEISNEAPFLAELLRHDLKDLFGLTVAGHIVVTLFATDVFWPWTDFVKPFLHCGNSLSRRLARGGCWVVRRAHRAFKNRTFWTLERTAGDVVLAFLANKCAWCAASSKALQHQSFRNAAKCAAVWKFEPYRGQCIDVLRVVHDATTVVRLNNACGLLACVGLFWLGYLCKRDNAGRVKAVVAEWVVLTGLVGLGIQMGLTAAAADLA